MILANPIALWSLLGLAVPIAIHLLSRKEGKVIRIGSVRHIQETSTQQFKGIKLNELALLALRCAMLFVFSLLLSGLQCSAPSNEKWIVVESGLENEPSITAILDSLKKEGYEKHFLLDGFPTKSDTTTEINYWKLTGQLDTKNLSSAVVLASNRLSNFRGERIPLASNIKWISVPGHSIDQVLQAIKFSNDSIVVRTMHSNTTETFFDYQKSISIPPNISSPDTVRLTLVSDDAFNYDRTILSAALRAIQKAFPIKLQIVESASSNSVLSKTDWCFWLSNEKIPRGDSLRVISIKPKNSTGLLVHVKPNEWELTQHLNEEVALEENLTMQLAELLIPSQQLHKIAREKDMRALSDSIAWSSGPKKLEGSFSTNANSYLIALLVLLLVIERFIAYKRNQ